MDDGGSGKSANLESDKSDKEKSQGFSNGGKDSYLDPTKVKMIENKHIHYGDLMDKALKYLFNGWGELLNYQKDGRYIIDNLVAERAIRPFTINKKYSFFMAVKKVGTWPLSILPLIETAKMYEIEV